MFNDRIFALLSFWWQLYPNFWQNFAAFGCILFLTGLDGWCTWYVICVSVLSITQHCMFSLSVSVQHFVISISMSEAAMGCHNPSFDLSDSPFSILKSLCLQLKDSQWSKNNCHVNKWNEKCLLLFVVVWEISGPCYKRHRYGANRPELSTVLQHLSLLPILSWR